MRLFAVICFVGGVAALGTLAVRRSNKRPWTMLDTGLSFVGMAGVVTGLILLFNRLQ
ncbi:MAG: hypothetical protein JNK21_10870 [Rhodospirillaceae bacterium]|nr:hypothetical protein [Rhodospirillaceae bacterium]